MDKMIEVSVHDGTDFVCNTEAGRFFTAFRALHRAGQY
ncbi:hypothetical protein VRK_36870 [Vibrio sp. MEBiC08052]|nr:hypothetical protein VRK_36870 [Vibrio sp. MEBiC08052]